MKNERHLTVFYMIDISFSSWQHTVKEHAVYFLLIVRSIEKVVPSSLLSSDQSTKYQVDKDDLCDRKKCQNVFPLLISCGDLKKSDLRTVYMYTYYAILCV
jgi:hypothetical protein